MKKTVFFAFILTVLIFAGCYNHAGKNKKISQTASIHSLTKQEKEQGWQLLFDGRTFRGWRTLGPDSIPDTWWSIENGTIHRIASEKVPALPGGQKPESCDLMTADTFLNFEFRFEWKISPQGNSGIKYNVSEKMSTRKGSTHALGFEYQIIDDTGYPEKLVPLQHTAALYALVSSHSAHPKQAGQWNSGRIILNGNHGEHWLNGEKVVEYKLGTSHFDSLFQKSKYHIHLHFPKKRYGHIVLQDHGDEVWFRNLWIRRIEQ